MGKHNYFIIIPIYPHISKELLNLYKNPWQKKYAKVCDTWRYYAEIREGACLGNSGCGVMFSGIWVSWTPDAGLYLAKYADKRPLF